MASSLALISICIGSFPAVVTADWRDVVPVDGAWSDWGAWGPCSVSCAGGTQIKIRTCSQPGPLWGGKFCEGINKVDNDCNPQPCPGKHFNHGLCETFPWKVGNIETSFFLVRICHQFSPSINISID